jgi:Uncharacterized protein conserved in bacteria (DUF2130)
VQAAALVEDHEIVAELLGTAVLLEEIDPDGAGFTVTEVLAEVAAPPMLSSRGSSRLNLIDGVWVTDVRCALPVAIALRQSLIELSAVRHAGEGQQNKMELVYQYLTGPRFRHRIEAIVEKFSDMQADLERERKAMTRMWAKREVQIRGVIESTIGMYGDLQGIAGSTLQEIDGLNLQLLDGPSPVSEGAKEAA